MILIFLLLRRQNFSGKVNLLSSGNKNSPFSLRNTGVAVQPISKITLLYLVDDSSPCQAQSGMVRNENEMWEWISTMLIAFIDQ